MTRRVCMWSGPRNVSTAIMYSFAQRGDTTVVDEPLYGHYLRVTGARHPGRKAVLRSMNTDGSSVMQRLATGFPDRDLLFAKQMAHHWVDLDPKLLEPFEHFLLVRDPHEMLPSLTQVLDDVCLRDTGLPDQVRLLEHLLSTGREPFCVDTRDLLSAPPKILDGICRRLGLSFQPCMTEWAPGPRPEDGVWAEWWYGNVHRSSGFRPWQPTRKTLSPQYEGLLAECLDLYGRLIEYSIRD